MCAHARTRMHTHTCMVLDVFREKNTFIHVLSQADRLYRSCALTRTGQAGKYPSTSVTMAAPEERDKQLAFLTQLFQGFGVAEELSIWGLEHRRACPRAGSVLFTSPANYQLSLLNVYYCLLETTDTFYIIINSN